MLTREGSSHYRFPEMEQVENLDEDEPATLPASSTITDMEQYGQLKDTEKIFVDAVLSAIENNNAELASALMVLEDQVRRTQPRHIWYEVEENVLVLWLSPESQRYCFRNVRLCRRHSFSQHHYTQIPHQESRYNRNRVSI